MSDTPQIVRIARNFEGLAIRTQEPAEPPTTTTPVRETIPPTHPTTYDRKLQGTVSCAAGVLRRNREKTEPAIAEG